MDTANAQAIKQEVKKHFLIYLALLYLTAINFILSKTHCWGSFTVGGILLIAAAQAALVACYFMHLISEKKLIVFILLLTFIFFLGLIFLPVLEFWGNIFGTVHGA